MKNVTAFFPDEIQNGFGGVKGAEDCKRTQPADSGDEGGRHEAETSGMREGSDLPFVQVTNYLVHHASFVLPAVRSGHAHQTVLNGFA